MNYIIMELKFSVHMSIFFEVFTSAIFCHFISLSCISLENLFIVGISLHGYMHFYGLLDWKSASCNAFLLDNSRLSSALIKL